MKPAQFQSRRELVQLLKDYRDLEQHWDTRAYRVAKKRARLMHEHDLVMWADNAGTQMCKVLHDYSTERDPKARMALLGELSLAITSFQALTEVLLAKESASMGYTM